MPHRFRENLAGFDRTAVIQAILDAGYADDRDAAPKDTDPLVSLP